MTMNTRQESTKQRFHRLRLAMALAGALAAIMLLSACSGSDSDDDDADAASGLDAQQVEAIVRTMSLPQGTANGGGIHANGSGVAIGEPDIAVLNVGVQAIEDTVTEARNEGALAIGRMLATLGEAGVANDDIETLRFTVQPRYEYDRDNEQTLTGYQVTNNLSVTIRNLDNVGAIIDGAVVAGGDAARIDSLRFEVEDGTALEDKARRLAIADAIAKADLYAELTGVSRGTLMSISESSFSPFPQTARVSFAMAEDAFASSAPTQVIAGEFEIRIDVQATFGIE